MFSGLAVFGLLALQEPARPLRAVVLSVSADSDRCPALRYSPGASIRADGRAITLPEWLASPQVYAFLAVDENANGIIDDATELVSNRMEGGSVLESLVKRAADGRSRLVIWRDRNANARSEPQELEPLPALSLSASEIREVHGDGACRARLGSLWDIEISLDEAVAAKLAAEMAAETPVVSVTASLVPAVDGYSVLLTNRGAHPIVAWAVAVNFEPRGGGSGVGVDTFPGAGPYRTGNGPIRPWETREIRIRSSKTDQARAVVEGVLFEDGTFEGRHRQRADWLRRREAYAAEYEDWLPLLRMAADGKDNSAAYGRLTAKLSEHQARQHVERSDLAVDDVMRQILPGLARNVEELHKAMQSLLRMFEESLKRARPR